MKDKIEKTKEEWRQILSKEQFDILRKGKTEKAFSGPYWELKEEGVYLCAGCKQELFSSKNKFDSGTGWPSFDDPISPGAISLAPDDSFFMKRTEVKCAVCDGHLGHVFDDGPKDTTGKRYCLNSHALEFKAKN